MKILLVDDHKLFCKSLKVILEMDEKIDLVDTCSNQNELFQLIEKNSYDVILLDLNLGNLSEESGLDIAKQILKNNSDEKIVMLTGYNKAIYEYEAIKIETKGFIDKETDPELLIQHLDTVYRGGEVFNLEVAESYNGKKIFIKKQDTIIEGLTQRERDILEKIRLGEEIDTISNEVGISKRTVFNHLGNIYQKLGAENKQEAIYKAEKLGYFSPKS